MRIQPRDEALAEPPDNAGGPGPLFVILEALLRRETRHADVVAGLAVAAGVAKIDDVYVVVNAGPDNARPTS
jgi:hypothetical protein